MEIRNTIDVQQLKVTPQDTDNTYLGIDENGQLVRTKIELNDDIDERINQKIYDEVTGNKLSFISGDRGDGYNWGNDGVEVFYATINNETILTDWSERKDFQLETKDDANTKYEELEYDLNVQKGSIQSFQSEINDFKNNKITICSGYDYDSAYYGNTLECRLKTINGETIIGDSDIKLETKDDANTKYGKLENDINKQNSNIQSFQSEINDFKNNKITISSGYDYSSAYYGNTLDCQLKTINGETLIGGGDITIAGGSGDSNVKVVTLTGTKPTIEEFNEMYESAISGVPTYIGINGGVFNIVATDSTSTAFGDKMLFYLEIDTADTYQVIYYAKTNATNVSSVKNKVFCSSGPFRRKFYSKDDNKLYSGDISDISLPTYYGDNSKILAPISIDRYANSATIINDGKLYYWNFNDKTTNIPEGSIWYLPKVVDLVNISGGSGDIQLKTINGISLLGEGDINVFEDTEFNEWLLLTENDIAECKGNINTLNNTVGDINKILETI